MAAANADYRLGWQLYVERVVNWLWLLMLMPVASH